MRAAWRGLSTTLPRVGCTRGCYRAKANISCAGFTSQWDEVKKKDKTRAKPTTKEGSQDFTQSNGRPARGVRGAFESGRGGSTRGGRGGSERGGRGGRGGRVNGTPRPRADEPSAATTTGDWVNSTSATGNDWETQETKPVDDAAGAWDTPAAAEADVGSGWDTPAKAAPAAPAAVAPKPKAPVAAPAKTWSSLLKAPPAPPAPKKAPAPPKPVIPEPLPEPVKEPEPEPEPELPAALPAPVETTTVEEAEPEVAPEEPAAPEPVAEAEVPEPEPVKEEEPEVTPQPLTETNLEKVEDVAAPQITETQASTVGSNLTRTTVGTPVPAVAPATPRTKAALVAGLHKGPRTPGFSRRTLALDQSEPVVMPSNHAVDRATVQFGSLNLDGGEADIDDDREEPETIQPPQPSPPVQPIASLPPSQPAASAPTAIEQTQPATIPRQAPGLPPQPQAALSQSAPQTQNPLGPQNILPQQQPSITAPYNRFGVPDQTQQQQKPFEPFAQQQPQAQPQTTQPSQYQQQPPTAQAYGYPTHQQPTSHPGQVGLGGVSSLPNYYDNYAERQPAPGFGYDASGYQQQLAAQQQQAHHQQDQSAQRPGLSSAGESSSQLSTSAPSQAHNQHLQSRYGIPQVTDVASGHATPSPGIPTPQQTTQGPQIPAAQYPINPYPYSQHPAYAAYYMHSQVCYSQGLSF